MFEPSLKSLSPWSIFPPFLRQDDLLNSKAFFYPNENRINTLPRSCQIFEWISILCEKCGFSIQIWVENHTCVQKNTINSLRRSSGVFELFVKTVKDSAYHRLNRDVFLVEEAYRLCYSKPFQLKFELKIIRKVRQVWHRLLMVFLWTPVWCFFRLKIKSFRRIVHSWIVRTRTTAYLGAFGLLNCFQFKSELEKT